MTGNSMFYAIPDHVFDDVVLPNCQFQSSGKKTVFKCSVKYMLLIFHTVIFHVNAIVLIRISWIDNCIFPMFKSYKIFKKKQINMENNKRGY